MKKFNQITMAVVIISAIFAASATFTSCESFKSTDDASGRSMSTRYQGYRIIDGKIKAIDMDGNTHEVPEGIIPELRAERIYREEGTNPLAAQSLAPRQLNTASPATTTTSFPYNYGINNEVTASLWLEWNGVTLRPLDTLFVKGSHVVDNTTTGPFVEQSHTQYTLCWADGSTIMVSGDSISCRQNFAIREVLPTIIHDTTTVVVHDTVFETRTVVVYDTIINGRWVTRWEARTRVAVHTSHTATTATDTYENSTHIYVVKCLNRTDSVFTERLLIEYNDGTVDSSMFHSWTTSFPWYKVWARTVTLNGSNPGTGRANVVSNTANFGGGNSIAFSAPTVTTTPTAGMENTTDCNDVLVYVTSVTGGVNVHTVVCHGNSADSTQGFVSWAGGTTPPTIIRVDTLWGACTTATAWYQPTPAEQVKATVGKSYTLERVWSDSTRTTVAGGTATSTYTWNIIRTGQSTSAMISIIPANGNPVSFGGGAFTEELTQVGSQRFCPLLWNSATLTTNGTVWSGTYAGTTVNVTVPETFVTPTPWEDVVYMVVTDGYEQQIFSAQSQRHQFLEIITYNSATGYKKFYKDVTNMPTVMPSRSSCDDSTSLTSAQYNFYVSSASNGFYATQVIPHNGSTTLYDGVVGSQELSNWWQLTFRLTNNTQAYVMGGSSWTMAGDNGRNALRGIADTTNHTITVDYGSGNTRTWAYSN